MFFARHVLNCTEGDNKAGCKNFVLFAHADIRADEYACKRAFPRDTLHQETPAAQITVRNQVHSTPQRQGRLGFVYDK